MLYQPITSFRRAMDAAPVQPRSSRALPAYAVDKWDALRELAVARKHFGLSDRDLTVLQALLSFHPGTKLEDPARMVVFPSNATLCERLNGMPCSTMRRHLARLVDTGLIARRDSPNGKRYRRREGPAFGFDLTPLACRFGAIQSAANALREEQHRIRTLRERVILIRRDLLGLLQVAPDDSLNALAENAAKALRRKLTLEQLESLQAMLNSVVEKLAESAFSADDLGSSGNHNEHHQYSEDKYIPDSDSCHEQADEKPDLEFQEVIASCNQIQELASEPIGDWLSLVRVAEEVRPMMGICASAWQQAVDSMGKIASAVALAAMLQRFDQIRAPGAYLRVLSAKALRREFFPAAMVRSLQGSQL
ncbi:plasmid replication protein RepC [Paracoccus sp. KR1-242]|uniref:plasmid replication protein RepC n=1 Tax=Paracoccus sp. KR1-242 TaxID=3410028 RepID=UPI003C10650D